MSNFVYDGAANDTYDKIIDWSAGTNFKIIGVSSGYTPATTDGHLDAIVSGNRITAGVAIAGCSVSGRIFKFSAALFPAVTVSAVITYVVGYIDTPGADTGKRLLFCIDTAATLPATGTGADMSFTPDGTLGLFNF